MCKEWAVKKFDRIKKAPMSTVAGWIFGKFFFGIGLGILLVAYFPNTAWIWAGWLFIVLSILVALPALKTVFGK